MNKHSIKVPRLYKVSALVAKEVSEGIGSIKSLVYEKQKKHPNIKAIYALVATLFQKTDEIETLLKRSQLLVKEARFEPWLAKVLIVELLWGKKYLPGQSKPENTIRAYEQIFKAHLSDDITTETNSKEHDCKPRYVRINTILTNLNEALDSFRDDGWTLNKFLDKTDYKGFLEKIISLNNEEFMVDIHVPNLLVFPSKTTFYNHPAYKNGLILLQDKASCLPVHILGPPPGSTVLDMCAAPGMKTTHLAAVLNNQGIVYATERNPKRFETLSKIVESSGATCVKTYNMDVLDCTKEDFPGVEYILVDPSCSGTGMTDRQQENELTQSRLSSLTGFQIKILRHALTKFPDVKKVVYSTCSVLPEENEDVVRQVLETNYNFKLVPANPFVGDTWQNFGSPDFGDIGKHCLYAKPNEDYTNGFFVAVFERLEEGEENQFFNTRIFNFKKHVQANEKWKEKKQKKFEKEKQSSEETILRGDNLSSSKNKPKKSKNEDVQNETEVPNNTKDVNNEEINDITISVKKGKKKQKETSDNNQDRINLEEEELTDGLNKKPKKKKRDKTKENTVHLENLTEENDIEEKPKKKKKNRREKEELDANKFSSDEIKTEEINSSEKKKKSKKKTEYAEEKHSSLEELMKENDSFEEKPKKKKRKNVEEIGKEDEVCLKTNMIVKNEKKIKKEAEQTSDIEQFKDEANIKKKKKKVKILK